MVGIIISWDCVQGGLCLCNYVIRRGEDGLSDGSERVVAEVDTSIWKEASEGFELEKRLDVIDGFPTGEDLELGERNGDFGFVVCVGELLGILLMEAGGKIFIRVDLEGKCFLDGEDLKVILD